MTSEVGFHGAQDSRTFPTLSIGNIRLDCRASAADKSAMASLLKRRVEERLGALEMNAFEAARAGELERNFVNDILNEKKNTVRGPNLLKLAKALRCSADYLIREDAPAPRVTALDDRMVPQFLGVRFRVRAGLWEEVGSEEPIDSFDYAVAPNPRFADWPQWLELVAGDSANELIPDKHLAHVVDAVEMGYAPQDEDVVVVERRRDGGATRERTIKQVEIRDGVIQLWPRSTNPKWSKPVSLTDGARDGEDIEVEVVGLVIGSYNPTLLKRR